MDETRQKIIDAAMALIREKGYVATTTKEIAKTAGVNECTLFRKFQNKKEIVLQGVSQAQWRADITPDIFQNVVWELSADLQMFMKMYMDRMTPDFVNLSIGLRAPQLYEETAPFIQKVPQAFLTAFTDYLCRMQEMGKLPETDVDTLAVTFFSAAFGYTFLRASFGEAFVKSGQDAYIRQSVQLFLQGIGKTGE